MSWRLRTRKWELTGLFDTWHVRPQILAQGARDRDQTIADTDWMGSGFAIKRPLEILARLYPFELLCSKSESLLLQNDKSVESQQQDHGLSASWSSCSSCPSCFFPLHSLSGRTLQSLVELLQSFGRSMAAPHFTESWQCLVLCIAISLSQKLCSKFRHIFSFKGSLCTFTFSFKKMLLFFLQLCCRLAPRQRHGTPDPASPAPVVSAQQGAPDSGTILLKQNQKFSFNFGITEYHRCLFFCGVWS